MLVRNVPGKSFLLTRFRNGFALLVLGLCMLTPRASQAQGGGGPGGGGPTPQGTWSISVSYTGQAQTTLVESITPPQTRIAGNYSAIVQGINLPANTTTSITPAVNAHLPPAPEASLDCSAPCSVTPAPPTTPRRVRLLSTSPAPK